MDNIDELRFFSELFKRLFWCATDLCPCRLGETVGAAECNTAAAAEYDEAAELPGLIGRCASSLNYKSITRFS